MLTDGCAITVQCTLAYKKLGINPIVMSAGELESGNAGEPAKLVRYQFPSYTFPSYTFPVRIYLSTVPRCLPT